MKKLILFAAFFLPAAKEQKDQCENVREVLQLRQAMAKLQQQNAQLSYELARRDEAEAAKALQELK